MATNMTTLLAASSRIAKDCANQTDAFLKVHIVLYYAH
jgi:hypothetical protein